MVSWPRPKVGMPEGGRGPLGRSPREAGRRDAAGQPRNPGWAPPLADGTGKNRKAGVCHSPGWAGSRGPGRPARRSPGHAAGRAPVHLPGGVQVHLHGGGGAAWPGPPGVAEPEATATAMEVEVDEDEDEAARRRGGRGRRGGLGQLGGRRLRRRLLLRRRLRWGLGDPGAPLAAAAPGASGTTARPSAFRHGPAGGGEARGLRGIEAKAKRTAQASLAAAAAGARFVSSPPARARERRHAPARAGPRGARSSRSPAAACCGSPPRRGWACPGRGREPRPAPAPPSARGGAALGRARPGQACGRARLAPRGRGSAARRPPPGPLLKFAASGALNLAAHFSPSPFPRWQQSQASSLFGARSRPGEGCPGARLGPSGL